MWKIGKSMRRTRNLREIGTSEDGALLPFFGVSLVAFLGMVALSFDLGRIDVTQSELQSFADSVALAAAGELDRQPDSITRATAAAANLIADRQTYGGGGNALGGVGDYQLSFYETLPAADTAALGATTGDPRRASYVRVAVNSKTVGLTFAAAFLALQGGPNNVQNTVQAFAIAGFTQFACDISPLMFCIPSGWSANANVGNMINLRSGGGNGSFWGPGDFGFLDLNGTVPVDPNGPCAGSGNLRTCLMAAEGNRTQCFPLNGVDVQPGQAVGITDAAINTRFDMYTATANNLNNGQRAQFFQPAPNVVKGILGGGGGGCNWSNGQITASPDTMALPRDNCLIPGNPAHPCATGNGRFGNGTWDSATYVTTNHTNHGGTDPTIANPLPAPLNGTRWEMYLAEIAAASPNILPGGSETGLPQCNSQGPTPDPNRRVMIAAGIDCTANPINGSTPNVPVQEFVRIFLTEPVGDDGLTPPTFDIWGEVIGSAGGPGAGAGGAGAIVHDVVQLYR